MKTQGSTGVTWDRTALGISCAIIMMALVVLVGWYGHIRAAIEIFGGLIPMQYNTALCFLALGAAGIGLSTRRRLLMLGGGSIAGLMGAAVVLEYAAGISFGVDTLFFYPSELLSSAHAGRMALTTAISFFLTGAALVILAVRRGAYAIFGIITSVPLSVALTSLIGYSFQITYVLPFGLGTQMALHTSAAFLAYGIAMLGYVWKYAERGQDGLPKWGAGIGVVFLPVLLVAASALFPEQSWRVVPLEVLFSILGVALITLAVRKMTTVKVAYKGMLMIAIPLILLLVFVGLVVHVKRQSESAQVLALHSNEVIGVSQSLLGRLTEAESAVRGYIITGDETFVNSYARSAESVTQTTTQFRNLVSNNPVQEASAGKIGDLTAQRMGRLAHIVGLINTGHRKEAEEDIRGGIGADLMKQVRAEMAVFSQGEERLDTEWRQTLNSSWQELSWLLVAGTAGSILLASILTLLFSGGISRRLQLLRDNAISLAEGKELAPPLTGRDEIAELDCVFHEMAESLDEVTRREKAVIEGTTDGISVKDLEHRYLMINQAGADVIGKTVEEIIGSSADDFMAPETARRVHELDAEALEGGKTTTHELVATTKAGVRRTYLTTRGPYRDRHGNVVGIIGINRDITQRKRAEAELQAITEIVQGVITTSNLEELFALAHQAISKLLPAENCFVALYDKTSNLLRIPFCKDKFDPIAAPHKLGRGLTAFVLRSGRPMFMTPDLIQELVSKGEIELVGTLPAVWLGVPLRTSTDIIGVLVVQHYEDKDAYSQQDLDLLASVADQLGLAIERKQIEMELKMSEVQLTEAQHIAKLGSWQWDVVANRVVSSKELYHILGLQPHEFGANLEAYLSSVYPEDREKVDKALAQALNEKEFPDYDFRIVRPDGAVRTLEASGRLILDDAGNVIRIVGIAQDITERRRAEKERDVISEVAQSINLTSNLDELLALIHQSLRKALYAENCFVSLYDKETGLFNRCFYVDRCAPDAPPQPFMKSCSAYVYRTGRPLLMNSRKFQLLVAQGEVELVGTPSPSWLGVPLKTASETIGVLVVQHHDKDDVYSEQDLEFLTSVGSQIALAIERKWAEEAVIESNRRFRDLFYDAPVGYHEIDIEGRITCVNTTELLMLGYSSEEMIGHQVWEFIEESEIARNTFAEKLAGNKPLRNVERAFRRKDGTYLAVQLDDQMLKDPGGRIIGIRATMQDIVERKRTEEALIQSEQRFRDLIENASDVIYTADFNGNFTSLNRSGERMTGYTREEALHLNFSQIVSPETLKLVQEMTARKLANPDETVYEVEFFKKGGEPLLVEVSSRAIYKDGKPVGIQGIGRDITQRKQVEAELKLARDAALESVRLKSEFLANMSHEIRTPMNGVIGMAGLLSETDLTAEQREYAETIDASAEALLTIIDDILDFSKIEAGLMRFEKIDFDLRGAVEVAVDQFAERAQARGLELASLVYQDVPTALQGDPGRLRQVLTNLAGNAVKFTEKGEVVISVKTVSETESHATVRFEIRDTGIGISAEAQRGLFQPFTQADGSTTRKYGGTGLGLAISKQLVELMGGQIGIESIPGSGSIFWFTAEFEKQNDVATPLSKTAGSLSATRVLIVDDNTTNRSILNHQTSSWGMIAREAESGERALELLRASSEQGRPFDIAILDLMMPEMDGFQLAEAIKADPSIAAVALILLPSFGKRGHGEKARELGIAAYLQKPVRQSKLYDCLTEVMGRAAGADPVTTAADLVKQRSTREVDVQQRDEKVSNLRIIIAEDNAVNRRVALGQLYNLGYRAESVSNGRELLKVLENTEFDLILMDCQMPEMDGFDASAEIRRLEGITRHTTIIAMTANVLDGDLEKCIAAGMDDYLSKPVKAAVLRQKLERWTRPAETASYDEGLSNPEALAGNRTGNIIDRAQLDSLREIQQPGKDDFVTELIDLFVNVTVSQMKILHEAVAAHDVAKTRRVAHFLMGSSANIGARQMASLYDQLEGNEGANGDAEALLKRLDQEFELVREALNGERLSDVTL